MWGLFKKFFGPRSPLDETENPSDAKSPEEADCLRRINALKAQIKQKDAEFEQIGTQIPQAPLRDRDALAKRYREVPGEASELRNALHREEVNLMTIRRRINAKNNS
jgi:hypothetical protein